MMHRLTLLAGIMLSLVLLGGCINYEEQLTLNKDGSGTIMMHYWMDSTFAQGPGQAAGDKGPPMSEQQANERFATKPGITLQSFRTEEKDGDTHSYVTLAFDSVTNLSAAMDGRDITFSEEGGVITFTSTVESESPGPEAAMPLEPEPASEPADGEAPEMPEGMEGMGEAMGEAMAKGMEEMMGQMMGSMGDGEFTFNVTFPGEVLEVEGPGATKAENTATWKLSLGDVMTGSSTMKATAKAPGGLPMLWVIIGAAVIVLVAGLLMRRK